MTKERWDAIAAAIIALVQSVFPVLVLLGAVDWTTDTIAAVMLVVTNTMTVIGLVVQPAFNTAASNVVKVNFDAAGKTTLDQAA